MAHSGNSNKQQAKMNETPARAPNYQACLVVIHGLELGKRYNLNTRRHSIGKDTDNNICITQSGVSAKHAVINSDNGINTIHDLDSESGVFINNERITQATELKDGDCIKIGRTILKYLSSNELDTDYHEEIYRLTTTDGLTGIYNKRSFMETLDREINRSGRYQRALTTLFFEVSDLDKQQQKHGNLAFDDILRQLAALINNNIRRDDLFARYSDTEFAIIVPELDKEASLPFAQKLHTLVKKHKFNYANSEISIEIHIGIASMHGESISTKDFIEMALTAKKAAWQTNSSKIAHYTDLNT